ncbi:MAG TPA: nucleotidyl transferase AbiEii/AbiGii toxin family protein [Thermoanaerobaculia bacterium]
MFEREAHHRVAEVLQTLDSERLAQHGFLFGGGTRIVLELGEYRLSEDIDFLCSDASGYADLRLLVAEQGFAALFRAEDLSRFKFPREIRIDQYGLRFPLVVDGHSIKVEMIREGRIDLDGGLRPWWSPVDCLSASDCFAEKLLANSDRWPDKQVLSRALIDLAALRHRHGPIPEEAWRKAEAAYKGAVRSDLRRSAEAFLENGDYRKRCFAGLSVSDGDLILGGVSELLAKG